MKRLLFIVFCLMCFVAVNGANKSVLKSSRVHIKFMSTTPAEYIESNNYTSSCVIDTITGNVLITVPMQSFQFEKELMQKHFNNKNFLHTKKFPKSVFKAKIVGVDSVNFGSVDQYSVVVEGDMTIKGVTNRLEEKAILIVSNKKIMVTARFDIQLSDYGIIFKKGKPATNVAKVISILMNAEFDMP